MPITAIVKPMNESGPPASLEDEAQPVDIIVDHIDRHDKLSCYSVSHDDD